MENTAINSLLYNAERVKEILEFHGYSVYGIVIGSGIGANANGDPTSKGTAEVKARKENRNGDIDAVSVTARLFGKDVDFVWEKNGKSLRHETCLWNLAVNME